MPCSSTAKKATAAGGCTDCSCQTSTTSSTIAASRGGAVSLPARKTTSTESTPLLWSTTSSTTERSAYQAIIHDDSPTSSATHVEEDSDETCPVIASGGQGSVCCREHRVEERTLIDPDLARDCIVGLSDGLTVPFALTAGLSSVGSSHLVVLAGLAELVSGAISMGIGGFLSAQAELSHFHYHERNTQARLLRSCDSEIDRQVEEILKDYGVEKETCRRVAGELRRKERERREREEQVEERRKVHARSKNRSRTRRIFGVLPGVLSSASSSSSLGEGRDVETARTTATVGEDEAHAGLTPFLLRVGSGLERVSTSRLYISALTIGLSYFLGGAIPLLPYVFIADVHRALLVSIVITGIILLAFGVVKQRVTGGEGGVKGYVYGAVSTLAVGGLAAGASWALVRLLEAKD